MTRRLVLSLVAILVAGAVTAGMVGAQEEGPTTPTLEATLSPTRVTVGSGNAVVPAGVTRLEFRNASRRAQATATLVALKEGVTVARFRRALRGAQRGPAPLKRVATFEAGGSLRPGGSYVTTVALKPDTTYIVGNITDNPTTSPLDTFETGQTPGSGTREQPDATVELYDYAFGMPDTLPRNGTVRFENQGERLHIAVAFPVRRGQSRVAAVRAFLTNNERRAGRLTEERRGFEPLGVVSGETANDVEVRFPRAGDWLFVCFIGDGERGNPSHNSLGMVKAFRVR
jgi:hypothetical protein